MGSRYNARKLEPHCKLSLVVGENFEINLSEMAKNHVEFIYHGWRKYRNLISHKWQNCPWWYKFTCLKLVEFIHNADTLLFFAENKNKV